MSSPDPSPRPPAPSGVGQKKTLLSYAEDQIHHMTRAPEMWGGPEAVELQVLLLLNVCEAQEAPPHPPVPRRVQDAYEKFAELVTGTRSSAPLSAQLQLAGRGAEFPDILASFARGVVASMRVRRAQHPCPLLFGLDFDGTLAADPELFGWILATIGERGHQCVVVTGRSDEGRWGQEVRQTLARIGAGCPIVFAANGWKRQAAEAAGYRVDIWIDDHPEYVAPQDPQIVATRAAPARIP